MYSSALFNDRESKKRARDEKFSLSKGVKKAIQASKPVQSGGNKWRGGAGDSNIPKIMNEIKDKDKEKINENVKEKEKTKVESVEVRRSDGSNSTSNNINKNNADNYIETNTSKPIPIIIPSDKRKMRIGTKTKTTPSGRVLAPSGKFRKSTDGYFRKKLRNQSSSEFSA